MAKSLELDTDLQLLPVPTTPVFQRGRVGLVIAATALALGVVGCGDDDDGTPDAGPTFDAGVQDMGPGVFDGGISPQDLGTDGGPPATFDAGLVDSGPPLVFDGGISLPDDGGATD
jgi:hypothetical protein